MSEIKTPPKTNEGPARAALRKQLALSKVIIMVPNHFGRGDTVAEAKAGLKKVRGKSLKANEPQVWWVASKDTTVDPIDGGLI